MTAPVRRVRAALFVPAHQQHFRDTAIAAEADAVILDLEDAVPPAERDRAREALGGWLGSELGPAVCVRINALADDCLDADLEAAVRPGLTAVMTPKVSEAEDVRRVADAIDAHEARAGLDAGTVRVWPIIETAAAVRNAYEMACASDRVAYMGSAAAPNGDLAHALGFGWTDSFLETLFVRSKVLVDMRAAGVQNPMTGVITNLHDLGEVESFARQSRAIGYEGMMVIHPSHVAVVNAVFDATTDDVAAARRLLEAWEGALRDGAGALNHEGQMIDAAMVRVAQDLLDRHAHSAPTESEAAEQEMA